MITWFDFNCQQLNTDSKEYVIMEKYQDTYCKYCNQESILNFAEILKCYTCNKYVHISCLKRQSVPGGIFGDTFFKFTCQECSASGNEVFIREKMTWFQVIILILYHVQSKTAGTANKGFFHWRIHLVSFIDKKWNILFRDIKRRKNWMGTVSGSLSHFSPCFFTSGTRILGSNGWWKLTFPELTPTASILIYNEITANKLISLKTCEDIIHIKNLIRKYVPRLEIEDDTISPEISQESNEKIQEFMENINVDVEDELESLSCKLFDASSTILQHDFKINQILDHVTPLKSLPKQKKKKDVKLTRSILKHNKTNFYSFWQNHERKIDNKNVSYVAPLRVIEENTLHNFILKQPCKNRLDTALKRKLHVRYMKRKHSLQTLNVDEIDNEILMKIRTRHYTTISNRKITNSLEEKIMARGKIGSTEYFISPYTNRLLKPFIRRDTEPKSQWLNLMNELMEKVNEKQENIDWTISSLDYVYVQTNHIPVINSLCEQYFWPGIDLSEALEYPEFSCVVLYKKLIVAFGFMVPDIKFNETYISFIFTRPEWRRGKIATFMIYHLIQTCMGKDVTLHVAVDNPAIFLYQKFGFKVEEVVFNFYDTYLRDDSKQSKHAFFLRLER